MASKDEKLLGYVLGDQIYNDKDEEVGSMNRGTGTTTICFKVTSERLFVLQERFGDLSEAPFWMLMVLDVAADTRQRC